MGSSALAKPKNVVPDQSGRCGRERPKEFQPKPRGPQAMTEPRPQTSPTPAADSSHCSAAELALIERVCAGDKESFYPLIAPYQRGVFLAALSVLKNEADAEEIAQESLLKAFKALSRFRRESKLSTWLIQITINEARMRLRKDRKHLYESTDEPEREGDEEYRPKDFADWREIPSESLERKQLRLALADALAGLAPKYREVFVLRDIQKLNIAETAQTLGITAGSVKTRLLRARLQMRDALAPGLDGAWTIGDGSWKKVRPW